jgi:UDP-N-acetyl-D-galactosamine dehydrogenase
VDPYYLTAKAKALGYHPHVILAGRNINDGMGPFIAQRMIKFLVQGEKRVKQARVGILGLTFKENVPDLRNSRVPDIVRELKEFGIEPLVHDPHAPAQQVEDEYGIRIAPLEAMDDLDGVILAVPHRDYMEPVPAVVLDGLKPGGVVVDVKSALDPCQIPEGATYWSL